MVEEIVAWIVYAVVEYGSYIYIAATALYANYQTRAAESKARRRSAFANVGEDRKQMVTQPITAHRVIYGQVMVSGPVTFLHTTDNNVYLHLIVTLAAHEIEAIDDVFFDDVRLDIDSDGVVQGRFFGHVNVYKGLGSTAGDAALRAALETNCPGVWTSAHRQTGRAKIYVRLKWNNDLFPNGIPNVYCIVRGKKVYDPRTALTSYSNNAALCIRDYLSSAAFGLGATNDEIDDVGMAAEANICDENVAVGAQASEFYAWQMEPPGVWNGQAYRFFMSGAVYYDLSSSQLEVGVYSYYVTFVTATGETLASAAVGPIAAGLIQTDDSGIQQSFTLGRVLLTNIPIGLSGVTARRIYRSGYYWATLGGPKVYVTTPKLVREISDNTTTSISDSLSNTALGVVTPSSNTIDPADLIVRSSDQPYLRTGDPITLATTGVLPAPLATGTTYYFIYVDRLLGALATSRANALSGTRINITDVGTGIHSLTRTYEARYACDGTLDTDATPRENLEALLTSCAGKLLYVGGKWTLLTAAYRAPTFTLTDDDLDGNVKVTTRLGKRTLCNGVKGVFVDPVNDWQPTDFPPVVNATYLTEDNNERLWRDVQMPFTLSPSMAQRLSKIELERTRQQISVELPCRLTALQVQVGDVVNFTYARFGWTAKPFEVSEFRFVVRTGEEGVPRLGVDLSLRETASGVYDWNSGEETTLDLAANTELPNFLDISTIAGLVLESGTDHLYVRQDGTVFSRIYVEWTAVSDSYVLNGGHIEIQYKLGSVEGDVWTQGPAVEPTATSAYLLDVQDLATYYVRVRAVNSYGVRSEWVQELHQVVGKTAAPADVMNFAVSQTGVLVVLRWDQVADRDLAGYDIRYGTSGVAFDDAITLTSVERGTSVTSASVPTGIWDFLIVARDTSGNRSANAARKSLAVSSDYGVISQTEQANDWVGHRALQFDGAVFVENVGLSQVFTAFTMECIIHGVSSADNTGTLMQIDAPAGLGGSGFGLNGGLLTGRVMESNVTIGDVVDFSPGVNLDDGRAHHVAFGHDGATGVSDLYVDGAKVVSSIIPASYALDQTTTQVRCGDQIGNLFGRYVGNMRQARLFSRKCTDAEVAEHAAFALSSATGLVVDWEMNEPSGLVCYDHSGNMYNGTVVPDTSAPASRVVAREMGRFVRHPSGVLVPDTLRTAQQMTVAEIFEQFVPYAVDTAIYDSDEIDISFDDTVRVWASHEGRLGRGETTGFVDLQLRLDYRAAAGGFDGFESWVSGDRTGRYFQMRLLENVVSGLAVVVDCLPTIDSPSFAQSGVNVVISAGGATVSFAESYHGVPTSLVVTPIGITALSASISNVTITGFTCQVFDSTGTDVGGTINYTALGV